MAAQCPGRCITQGFSLLRDSYGAHIVHMHITLQCEEYEYKRTQAVRETTYNPTENYKAEPTSVCSIAIFIYPSRQASIPAQATT